jgi:hypothetical protein
MARRWPGVGWKQRRRGLAGVAHAGQYSGRGPLEGVYSAIGQTRKKEERKKKKTKLTTKTRRHKEYEEEEEEGGRREGGREVHFLFFPLPPLFFSLSLCAFVVNSSELRPGGRFPTWSQRPRIQLY